MDGDAAAGEVAGSTNASAGRGGVAAAAAAMVAGGLDRHRGGALPAAAIDAGEGYVARPTELGLEAGAPVAAEVEAPGWEGFEASGTPTVAPPTLAVAATVVAATSEREIGSLPEGVLEEEIIDHEAVPSQTCLLYTSPSPRDQRGSRMPSSA